MQENKAFAASCGAWLYDLEARIGMRGILTVAPRTGQNVAIYIREPLRPIAFDMQQANPSSDSKLLIGLRRAAPRSGAGASMRFMCCRRSRPHARAARSVKSTKAIGHSTPLCYSHLHCARGQRPWSRCFFELRGVRANARPDRHPRSKRPLRRSAHRRSKAADRHREHRRCQCGRMRNAR